MRPVCNSTSPIVKLSHPSSSDIAMVKTAHDMYPDKFQWRQNEYEYEFGKNPFDVVSGTDKIRKQIEESDELEKIELNWHDELEAFKQLREKYLLY